MKRNEIKEHIQELYPTMPSTVQRVAKYVCANYDRAFLLGSSELASAVGVSDTTVIRFAKILGISGTLPVSGFVVLMTFTFVTFLPPAWFFRITSTS